MDDSEHVRTVLIIGLGMLAFSSCVSCEVAGCESIKHRNERRELIGDMAEEGLARAQRCEASAHELAIQVEVLESQVEDLQGEVEDLQGEVDRLETDVDFHEHDQ